MASECGCKLDLVIVHASDGPTTDSIINRSECRIADLERQLAEAQQRPIIDHGFAAHPLGMNCSLCKDETVLALTKERDAANARAEAAERERDRHRQELQQIATTVCPTSELGDPEFNVKEICAAIMAGAGAMTRIAQLEAALRGVMSLDPRTYPTEGLFFPAFDGIAFSRNSLIWERIEAALATPGSGEQGFRTNVMTTGEQQKATEVYVPAQPDPLAEVLTLAENAKKTAMFICNFVRPFLSDRTMHSQQEFADKESRLAREFSELSAALKRYREGR